jgi:Mrp family chromosome partitioning ATPase
LPADQSLNTLRLYGGAEFSVAEKVRWFRSLIASARQLFGIILIDVPPLVRCAEGYLLASESDGVVMVLKSGQVRKPAAMSLRAELQRMNIPILGGILTFRRYPLPQWLLRVL